MSDPLTPLLADGVIEAVVGRLKSGKEADIFLVQHAGEIVAAKVYKERHARSFHNNAAYKEGRRVRNSRTQRAIDRGSRFGQAAEEEAWKATESDVLHQLFAAGVRVPKPYVFYEGVLLMEAVIDADGHPAPRLIDAPILAEQAAAFYADIRAQLIKMLLSDLIHGDLSPYNVLLAWNGPTLIDFPQVVGAAHNNRAEFFFQRDLDNIRLFFARFDPSLTARAADAWEIFRAYQRRELTPDFIPTARAMPGQGGGPQRSGAGRGRKRKRSGQQGQPRPKGNGEPQAAAPQRHAPVVGQRGKAEAQTPAAPGTAPSQGQRRRRRRPRR